MVIPPMPPEAMIFSGIAGIGMLGTLMAPTWPDTSILRGIEGSGMFGR